VRIIRHCSSLTLSVKTMRAHGEFPETLFRSFDKLEYAQQFVSGSIRFGTVLSYKKNEDERRRDATEGTGRFVCEGVQSEVEFCSNVVYALCCHKSLESALKTNYGKYIVEIGDPLYLAEEITRTLRNLNTKHFGGIEGVSIEYTKGEAVSQKPNSYGISRLTYSQKPPCFSDDNEFRFIFIHKEFAGNHIFIPLNKCIKGCVIHDYT